MSEQSETPAPDVKDSAGNLFYDVSDTPFGAEQDMKKLFHFNPEEFDAETEDIIAIERRRSDEDKDSEERRSARLEGKRESRKIDRDWLEKYSGKIPETWGGRYGWMYTIASIENGLPLTDDMIDAAIDHPSWLAGYHLGTERALNEDQFERLLARNNGHNISQELKTAQKELREGRNFIPEVYRRLQAVGLPYSRGSGTVK